MYPGSRYFLLLAVLLLPPGLRAQASAAGSTVGHQEVDLALTYTAQYSNLVSTPTFWHSGGTVELSTQTYRGFGLAANVTGTQTNSAADSGNSLSLVTATFGPRYTWFRPSSGNRNHSLAIFGQGLVGQAWGFDSYFPDVAGVRTNAESLALQVGGGVDLGWTRHIGIRVFQADWLRTQLPNGSTNVQNTLRLGAGIVLRLP